jgi:hypothetical protein
MRYSKPQVVSSESAVSTIQQVLWNDNPHDGVFKGDDIYQDSQNPKHICTRGAYESDE